MDMQDLMFRAAEAAMGDDPDQLEALVGDLEAAVAGLGEAQADTAEMLHGQIALLKPRVASLRAMGGGFDALMAKMQEAEAAGDTDAVEALMEQVRAAASAMMPEGYAPEVYPQPYEDLREAIDDGDMEALDRVLAEGVDLNGFTDQYGAPPLVWAMIAEDRSPEVIGKLIAHGADASHSSAEGYNALHFVADTNFLDKSVEAPTAIAGLLVENGAELEARTHWGWTPLYRAVFEGTATEMEALLRNGADPNVPPVQVDAPGCAQTQLPLLAAGHDTEKVRLLLDYGADAAAVRDEFEADAVEAARSTAAKQAAGDTDAFWQEYADGYAASLDLIRGATTRRH